LPTKSEIGDGRSEIGGTSSTSSSNKPDVAASLRDAQNSHSGSEHGSQSRGYKEPDNTDVVLPSTEAIDTAAAEEIEKLAEKLVEREPKSLPHRTLLALARLRGGHRTRALDAYNIEVPEEIITPSAVAVRAAILYANGRVDEARDLIKQISIDQLVAEERALIAPLL
jgi:hypothetical protein